MRDDAAELDLVEFGNAEALAAGVMRHFERPEAAAEMGRNARRVALSYFAHEAVREREGQFYRRLLGEAERASAPPAGVPAAPR